MVLKLRIMPKIKKIIILLCVLSVTVINYNIIVNGHFHLDENGQFYFHGHPYSKENDHSPLHPEHKHTQLEILYFSQILKLLSFFLIFLLIIFISTKTRSFLSQDYNRSEFNLLLIPLRRAPPIYRLLH